MDEGVDRWGGAPSLQGELGQRVTVALGLWSWAGICRPEADACACGEAEACPERAQA